MRVDRNNIRQVLPLSENTIYTGPYFLLLRVSDRIAHVAILVDNGAVYKDLICRQGDHAGYPVWDLDNPLFA